jgi:hypothetical protein
VFAGTGGWDGTYLETGFGRDGSFDGSCARHRSTSSFAIGSAEQRAACTPDVFRLCSSEIPNVDRIVACLKQQRSNLSKPCQAVMNSPIAKTYH